MRGSGKTVSFFAASFFSDADFAVTSYAETGANVGSVISSPAREQKHALGITNEYGDELELEKVDGIERCTCFSIP